MSKRVLYFECNTGISGDMTVAALLDAGASEEVLLEALKGIKDESFEIKISRVKKSGLDCCDFDVVLDAEHETHDHDMEYLYGHEHSHNHCHGHHDHDDEHTHDHHHAHVHRNPSDIKAIINDLDITDNARSIANRTFDILAEAEAKAHGISIDEVHFHEVGAIDSIVDVVAAAVCLDNLGVDEVIVKSISEGTGSVRCQHGVIPVPVPAVSNIAAAYKLPLKIVDREGEFVTPTGAALLAATITSKKLPESFTIERVGMGAGKRDYDPPGILRAMLINPIED
ncbi:MAG: LarC family nickel insertion protein [Firmicutes bacterium]|nr:LarC family nickel insertion protein [Bacillota bacterium]